MQTLCAPACPAAAIHRAGSPNPSPGAILTPWHLATTDAQEVVGGCVYAGMLRLLREALGRFGVESGFEDPGDATAMNAVLAEPTRLVVVETPANPTLACCDLAALARASLGAG